MSPQTSLKQSNRKLELDQHTFHLSHDLLIGIVLEIHCIAGASTNASPTPLTQSFIDPAYLLLLIKGNGAIGTNKLTNLAARADSFVHNGNRCFNLNLPLANHSQSLSRRRRCLGYGMRYIFRSLTATSHKYPVAHGSHWVQLGVSLQEEAISASADIKSAGNILHIWL